MKRLTLILTVAAFAAFACSAYAAEEAAKKWTIMVFINADNNLDAAGADDVNEMEMVGSTDQVNIVTMLDRAGSGGTKTYFVKKDSKPSQITSPVVRDQAEQDMGDWQTLVEFARFGIDNYPAEHYLLAIWNHGAGWQKDSPNAQLIKGISYDDESGNHMTTPQVGLAVKAVAQHLGRKLDIIAYDACLMQMAEVAAEVKDHALVQVGAEETEPGDGWPYDGFLAPLVANPTWNAHQLATKMVDAYNASYDGGSQGSQATNQSAVNLEKFDTFLAKLDAFSSAMVGNAALNGTFKQAMADTQAFYYSQYKDLGDFLKIVVAKVGNAAVKAAAQDLYAFYTNEVVIRSGHTGSNMAGTTGLSIYMPTKSQLDENLDAYRELVFTAVTHWDEFLQGIYYPNVPVLTVAGIDVIDGTDGAVNPGDTCKVIVRIQNEGMKPGLNLSVSVKVAGGAASVLGGTVAVDQVPATSTVEAPAIEIRVAENCPVDSAIDLAIKVVDAQGNVITGTAKVVVKQKFAVTADVLLLTVNKADAFTKFYAKALEDAGVAFDTYDMTYFGGATLPLLKQYANGVVMFHAQDGSAVNKVDLNALAAFMDAGGSLFITGQDVGYSIKDKPFYGTYLHASYVQDNTGIHDVLGAGDFAGLNVTIKGGDGANNQKWPDEINPLAPAVAVFSYKNVQAAQLAATERVDNYRGINASGTAGLFVNTGTYKAMYFAFGFEAISTAAARAEVMGRVIEMLRPTLADRIAGIKALAEVNAGLYGSGSAAFETAKRAEEHFLGLAEKLVVSPQDQDAVRASGLRDLQRRINAR